MSLLDLFTICIVIFMYIHIVHQLSVSNDLEIYEMNLPPPLKLEEVCNFKQPIVFEVLPLPITLDTLKQFNAFDVYLYDSGLPIEYEKAVKLFNKGNYAIYNNNEFLKETLLQRFYESLNIQIKPPITCSIKYDLLCGSTNFCTPLQYLISNRNYFMVTQGSIKMKLTCPKNIKYLNEIKNYESMEFFSKSNPWKESNHKVKYIDVTLKAGQMIYIPSYWWYTICLEKNACVCIVIYKTIMNVISNLNESTIGILQRHNTKFKTIQPYAPPLLVQPEP